MLKKEEDRGDLKVQMTRVTAENKILKCKNSRLEEMITKKETEIKQNSEKIESTELLLQKKDTVNSTLSQELANTREYLASHKQVTTARRREREKKRERETHTHLQHCILHAINHTQFYSSPLR